MRSKQVVQKNFNYYIEEYLHYCKSRNLRAKTMSSYEQTLRLFERWAEEREGITVPSEIGEDTIVRYICDLQERGKYSFFANEKATNYPERRRDYRKPIAITTINNYIRNLRAFFNWYDSRNPAAKNPMENIRQMANTRKRREYLEDEEIQKLLRCFDKSYFPECRDCSIIVLLLDTGMRLGECLSLTLDDVDFNERSILISGDIAKSRKPRMVFFSVKTGKILRGWIQFKDRYVETNYLFPVKATGYPVEIGGFETNFRNYIRRAGIEKDFSPHALRNNFAKRCLLAGMDIYTLSRILGHSSVTITEKAYLDLTDTDLRRRYENFSPMENLR